MRATHKVCTVSAHGLPTAQQPAPHSSQLRRQSASPLLPKDVLLGLCPVDSVPNGVFAIKAVPFIPNLADFEDSPRCPEDMSDWRLEASLEQHSAHASHHAHESASAPSSLRSRPSASLGGVEAPMVVHWRLGVPTTLRSPCVDYLSFTRNEQGSFVVAVLRNREGGGNDGMAAPLGRVGCHVLAFRIISQPQPAAQMGGGGAPHLQPPRPINRAGRGRLSSASEDTPVMGHMFTLCADDAVSYWPDRLVGRAKTAKKDSAAKADTLTLGAAPGLPYPELVQGSNLAYHVSHREPMLTVCFWVPGTAIEALRSAMAGKPLGYGLAAKKGMGLYATVLVSIGVQFCHRSNTAAADPQTLAAGLNGSFAWGPSSSPAFVRSTHSPGATAMSTAPSSSFGSPVAPHRSGSMGSPHHSPNYAQQQQHSSLNLSAAPSPTTTASSLKVKIRLAVTLLSQHSLTCASSAVMPAAWGRVHLLLAGCTDNSFAMVPIEPSSRLDPSQEAECGRGSKFRLFPADMSNAVKLGRSELVTSCFLSGLVAPSSATNSHRQHHAAVGTELGRIFIIQYSLKQQHSATGEGSDGDDDDIPLPIVTLNYTAKHLLPLHVASKITTIAFTPFAPGQNTSHRSAESAVVAVVTARGHVVLYRATHAKDTAMVKNGGGGGNQQSADDKAAPLTIQLMGVAQPKLRDVIGVAIQPEVLVLLSSHPDSAAARGCDEVGAGNSLALAARIAPSLSAAPTFVCPVGFEARGFAKGTPVVPLNRQPAARHRLLAGAATIVDESGTVVMGSAADDPYIRLRYNPSYAVGTPLKPKSALLQGICAEENAEHVPSISLVSRCLGGHASEEGGADEGPRRAVSFAHDQHAVDGSLNVMSGGEAVGDGGAAAHFLLHDPSDAHFTHVRILGQGTFGTVTLAQSRDRSADFFAVKRVPKGAGNGLDTNYRTRLSTDSSDGSGAAVHSADVDSIRTFFQEAVTVMTSIPPHAHIARYFGIYQTAQFHNIVMEVAEGGSLDGVLFPPYTDTDGERAAEGDGALLEDGVPEGDPYVMSPSEAAVGVPLGCAEELFGEGGSTAVAGSPSLSTQKATTADGLISRVFRTIVRPFKGQKEVSPSTAMCRAGAPSSTPQQCFATAAQRTLSPQVPHIPEHVLVCWLYQSLAGLHHLHSHGVVHRDVKAGNMLLLAPIATRPYDQRIVWTDFGVSAVEGAGRGGALGRGAAGTAYHGTTMNTINTGTGATHLGAGGGTAPVHTAQRTVIGTMGFTAPEMLEHWGTGGTATYSAACDLWSLGVIFYCYITGRGWLPNGGCVGVACSPSETIDVCCGRLPRLCALKASVLHEGISSSDDEDGEEYYEAHDDGGCGDGADRRGSMQHGPNFGDFPAPPSDRVVPLSRFSHVEQGRRAACFSDAFLSLIDTFLSVEYKRRPTAKAALGARVFAVSPARPLSATRMEHAVRQVRLVPGGLGPLDSLHAMWRKASVGGAERQDVLLGELVAALRAHAQSLATDPAALVLSGVARSHHRTADAIHIRISFSVSGCDYVQRCARMQAAYLALLRGDQMAASTKGSGGADPAGEGGSPAVRLVSVSNVCCVDSARLCELRPLVPAGVRRGWRDYCAAHFWRDGVPSRHRRVQPLGLAAVHLVYAMPKGTAALEDLLCPPHDVLDASAKLDQTRRKGYLPFGPIGTAFVQWLAFVRAAAQSANACDDEPALVGLFQRGIITAVLGQLAKQHSGPREKSGGTRIHGAIRPDNIFVPMPPTAYSPEVVCHLDLHRLLTRVCDTLVVGPADPFAPHMASLAKYCELLDTVLGTAEGSCGQPVSLHVSSPSAFDPSDLEHLTKLCVALDFVFDNAADETTISDEVRRLATSVCLQRTSNRRKLSAPSK